MGDYTIESFLQKLDGGKIVECTALLKAYGKKYFFPYSNLSALYVVLPRALELFAEAYDNESLNGNESQYFDFVRELWDHMTPAEQALPEPICSFVYAAAKFEQIEFMKWILPLALQHSDINIFELASNRKYHLNQLRHSVAYYIARTGSIEMYDLFYEACKNNCPFWLETKYYYSSQASSILSASECRGMSAGSNMRREDSAKLQALREMSELTTDPMFANLSSEDPDSPSIYVALLFKNFALFRHVLQKNPLTRQLPILRYAVLYGILPSDDINIASQIYDICSGLYARPELLSLTKNDNENPSTESEKSKIAHPAPVNSTSNIDTESVTTETESLTSLPLGSLSAGHLHSPLVFQEHHFAVANSPRALCLPSPAITPTNSPASAPTALPTALSPITSSPPPSPPLPTPPLPPLTSAISLPSAPHSESSLTQTSVPPQSIRIQWEERWLRYLFCLPCTSSFDSILRHLEVELKEKKSESATVAHDKGPSIPAPSSTSVLSDSLIVYNALHLCCFTRELSAEPFFARVKPSILYAKWLRQSFVDACSSVCTRMRWGGFGLWHVTKHQDPPTASLPTIVGGKTRSGSLHAPFGGALDVDSAQFEVPLWDDWRPIHSAAAAGIQELFMLFLADNSDELLLHIRRSQSKGANSASGSFLFTSGPNQSFSESVHSMDSSTVATASAPTTLPAFDTAVDFHKNSTNNNIAHATAQSAASRPDLYVSVVRVAAESAVQLDRFDVIRTLAKALSPHELEYLLYAPSRKLHLLASRAEQVKLLCKSAPPLSLRGYLQSLVPTGGAIPHVSTSSNASNAPTSLTSAHVASSLHSPPHHHSWHSMPSISSTQSVHTSPGTAHTTAENGTESLRRGSHTSSVCVTEGRSRLGSAVEVQELLAQLDDLDDAWVASTNDGARSGKKVRKKRKKRNSKTLHGSHPVAELSHSPTLSSYPSALPMEQIDGGGSSGLSPRPGASGYSQTQLTPGIPRGDGQLEMGRAATPPSVPHLVIAKSGSRRTRSGCDQEVEGLGTPRSTPEEKVGDMENKVAMVDVVGAKGNNSDNVEKSVDGERLKDEAVAARDGDMRKQEAKARLSSEDPRICGRKSDHSVHSSDLPLNPTTTDESRKDLSMETGVVTISNDLDTQKTVSNASTTSNLSHAPYPSVVQPSPTRLSTSSTTSTSVTPLHTITSTYSNTSTFHPPTSGRPNLSISLPKQSPFLKSLTPGVSARSSLSASNTYEQITSAALEQRQRRLFSAPEVDYQFSGGQAAVSPRGLSTSIGTAYGSGQFGSGGTVSASHGGTSFASFLSNPIESRSPGEWNVFGSRRALFKGVEGKTIIPNEILQPIPSPPFSLVAKLSTDDVCQCPFVPKKTARTPKTKNRRRNSHSLSSLYDSPSSASLVPRASLPISNSAADLASARTFFSSSVSSASPLSPVSPYSASPHSSTTTSSMLSSAASSTTSSTNSSPSFPSASPSPLPSSSSATNLPALSGEILLPASQTTFPAYHESSFIPALRTSPPRSTSVQSINILCSVCRKPRVGQITFSDAKLRPGRTKGLHKLRSFGSMRRLIPTSDATQSGEENDVNVNDTGTSSVSIEERGLFDGEKSVFGRENLRISAPKQDDGSPSNAVNSYLQQIGVRMFHKAVAELMNSGKQDLAIFTEGETGSNKEVADTEDQGTVDKTDDSVPQPATPLPEQVMSSIQKILDQDMSAGRSGMTPNTGTRDMEQYVGVDSPASSPKRHSTHLIESQMEEVKNTKEFPNATNIKPQTVFTRNATNEVTTAYPDSSRKANLLEEPNSSRKMSMHKLYPSQQTLQQPFQFPPPLSGFTPSPQLITRNHTISPPPPPPPDHGTTVNLTSALSSFVPPPLHFSAKDLSTLMEAVQQSSDFKQHLELAISGQQYGNVVDVINMHMTSYLAQQQHQEGTMAPAAPLSHTLPATYTSTPPHAQFFSNNPMAATAVTTNSVVTDEQTGFPWMHLPGILPPHASFYAAPPPPPPQPPLPLSPPPPNSVSQPHQMTSNFQSPTQPPPLPAFALSSGMSAFDPRPANPFHATFPSTSPPPPPMSSLLASPTNHTTPSLTQSMQTMAENMVDVNQAPMELLRHFRPINYTSLPLYELLESSFRKKNIWYLSFSPKTLPPWYLDFYELLELGHAVQALQAIPPLTPPTTTSSQVFWPSDHTVSPALRRKFLGTATTTDSTPDLRPSSLVLDVFEIQDIAPVPLSSSQISTRNGAIFLLFEAYPESLLQYLNAPGYKPIPATVLRTVAVRTVAFIASLHRQSITHGALLPRFIHLSQPAQTPHPNPLLFNFLPALYSAVPGSYVSLVQGQALPRIRYLGIGLHSSLIRYAYMCFQNQHKDLIPQINELLALLDGKYNYTFICERLYQLTTRCDVFVKNIVEYFITSQKVCFASNPANEIESIPSLPHAQASAFPPLHHSFRRLNEIKDRFLTRYTNFQRFVGWLPSAEETSSVTRSDSSLSDLHSDSVEKCKYLLGQIARDLDIFRASFYHVVSVCQSVPLDMYQLAYLLGLLLSHNKLIDVHWYDKYDCISTLAEISTERRPHRSGDEEDLSEYLEAIRDILLQFNDSGCFPFFKAYGTPEGYYMSNDKGPQFVSSLLNQILIAACLSDKDTPKGRDEYSVLARRQLSDLLSSL